MSRISIASYQIRGYDPLEVMKAVISGYVQPDHLFQPLLQCFLRFAQRFTSHHRGHSPVMPIGQFPVQVFKLQFKTGIGKPVGRGVKFDFQLLSQKRAFLIFVQNGLKSTFIQQMLLKRGSIASRQVLEVGIDANSLLIQ
ncbi:MAG: hypothetical protein IPJ40_19965 [Saprospirales bacterium]|nr:hypothetical protein [Saprospirales bacterium]